MKIKTIELTDDGNPVEVTARLNFAEVVYLTKLLGGMNGIQANEVIPNGADASHEIYDCLSQLLFQYYEEGVSDAVRDL